jgi:hypothetical protein
MYARIHAASTNPFAGKEPKFDPSRGILPDKLVIPTPGVSDQCDGLDNIYPPAVGYQTYGLDNKGRSKRILLLERAGGFTVCGPTKGPSCAQYQGKRSASRQPEIRAGGAVLVSPALQRGESVHTRTVPESRRDGAFSSHTFC